VPRWEWGNPNPFKWRINTSRKSAQRGHAYFDKFLSYLDPDIEIEHFQNPKDFLGGKSLPRQFLLSLDMGGYDFYYHSLILPVFELHVDRMTQCRRKGTGGW
jgi:hypothetical protein